jgi:hypothetical protein
MLDIGELLQNLMTKYQIFLKEGNCFSYHRIVAFIVVDIMFLYFDLVE